MNKNSDDKASSAVTIALSGNPNVGKSTVFNALTGLKQHTGNWPGKTVENAEGYYTYENNTFKIVDIPGTYSLMSCSYEEEVARDFICFGKPDVTVIVVDATCLERNLNLVLQILEITKKAAVCVNLLDEAEKKEITIDLDELSLRLGVPVIGTCARNHSGLCELKKEIADIAYGKVKTFPAKIIYSEKIEQAIEKIYPLAKEICADKINTRFYSVKLLEGNSKLLHSINEFLDYKPAQTPEFYKVVENVRKNILDNGCKSENLEEDMVGAIVQKSEEIYKKCVSAKNPDYNNRDRKIDRFLTSKITGIPVMIALLGIIFWITTCGANYPSQLLSGFFAFVEKHINHLLLYINTPEWLHSLFINGVYRTLTWVVAVMLPPMAIFFPLFTLLEDLGYLPRIAFNLDGFFRKSGAHGKQSLSMCMGFGCNACGVIGCRIIDSPREKLIAVLTNNFVPCNGRFPTLISVITMFFTGAAVSSFSKSALSALILTAVIILGVILTLNISKMLSKTLLKGMPSSFALELPPYRRPQIGKILVRSIFDRTLFVLGRAAAVAAPAGAVIWALANLDVAGVSILTYITEFLDPFAKLFGLDGVILAAFVIGLPANEIVLPVIIMCYMSSGTLSNITSLPQLNNLLIANGWTAVTALCMIIFCLCHFPCATTLLTIKKETKSVKWTFLSAAIPTVVGLALCFVVASIGRMFL